MVIFAEVVGERMEVSYSELPGQRYLVGMASLIAEAASQPYRRGQSEHWFAGSPRLPLDELNGRPC